MLANAIFFPSFAKRLLRKVLHAWLKYLSSSLLCMEDVSGSLDTGLAGAGGLESIHDLDYNGAFYFG